MVSYVLRILFYIIRPLFYYFFFFGLARYSDTFVRFNSAFFPTNLVHQVHGYPWGFGLCIMMYILDASTLPFPCPTILIIMVGAWRLKLQFGGS